MKIKERLFWERFRPNTINVEKGKIPIILLPRIRKIVESGIKLNMIFTGSGGLGKSTLAGILTQDTNALVINCSKDRGIDVLREEIDSHCKNYSVFGNKGIKVVWLEEFDNATTDMRKALRGFIEEMSETVRFVATVNNLAKLQRSEEDKALLSRFNIVDFDPKTTEEKEYLKEYQLKYLKAITKMLKFDISDDILVKLINNTFPNFRSTVQLLQEIHISGDIETYENMKESENESVYKFIMDGDHDVTKVFYYVTDFYPKDKTEELLDILSKRFFRYLLENHQKKIVEVAESLIDLSKEYNTEYSQTANPEIHLMNYIIKLKKLF